MSKGGMLVLVALLLTAPVLAGCIARMPGGQEEAPPGDQGARDKAPAEQAGYEPNRWLLDQQRPYTTTVSSGAEPMILASQDGTNLFIADTHGISRSQDNGGTWEKLGAAFANQCDGIDLAEDDLGVLYAVNTNCPAIEFARSQDKGDSWELSMVPVDAAPIADRPWISARGDGQVAIIFYDFGRTFTEHCLQSHDGGLTFTDRSVLDLPFAPPPNAGSLVHSEQGRLYWAVGTQLYSRGACSSPAGAQTVFQGAGSQVFTQADVAEDHRYVVAPTPEERDVQIAVRGVEDRDLTLDLPELKTNTFTTVSATPEEVAIAWYGSETEGDPESRSFDGAWNVWVAIVDEPLSLPEASTVTCEHAQVACHRVTDEPNHVGQICMGGIGCGGEDDRDLLDYFGIDHGPTGDLHIAYGHDGSGSDAEVRYACIGPTCGPIEPPPLEGNALWINETLSTVPATPGAWQSHRVEMHLEEGEELEVQLGWQAGTADLDIRVLAPRFEEPRDPTECVDHPGQTKGLGPAEEAVSVVAERTGTYDVYVETRAAAPPSVDYQLRLAIDGTAPEVEDVEGQAERLWVTAKPQCWVL